MALTCKLMVVLFDTKPTYGLKSNLFRLIPFKITGRGKDRKILQPLPPTRFHFLDSSQFRLSGLMVSPVSPPHDFYGIAPSHRGVKISVHLQMMLIMGPLG